MRFVSDSRRSRPWWATTLAFLLAAVSPAARGYEGAGMPREAENAEPPPKQPQLTRAPSVSRFVEAVYPPELLARRQTGSVTFRLTIDADGKVAEAVITGPSGEAAFDAAALDALKQFEFIPAQLDGVSAAIQLEYVYRFEPAPLPAVDDAPAPPPPVNLRGRILERGTRVPLSGAVVYVEESDLVAETDADGRFELRGVPSGPVSLRVSESKHKEFRTQEELRDGEVTELTAYLWKRVDSGFEVTVRGERNKKDVTRRTLEKQELTSVPGTFGDPVRVIQNLPGMARAPFTSGALLVRGSQPGDTQTLIDGVPIPLLYHFFGGPSVVNPSFIDRIDFFPGAYGSKYGRAIAGVVDIGTKPPEIKGYHGSFDVDLLDSGAYLEGPIAPGKPELGTWSLAGRRSYIDLLLPTVLDAIRQPGQAAVVASPRYWDYQSRYDVTLGKTRLEMSVFGSDDEQVFAQAGSVDTQGFRAGLHQGFHRARMKFARRLGDGWTASLAPTIGTTVANFNFNSQVRGDIYTVDFNTRGAVTKSWGDALQLEAGIDFNGNLYSVDFLLPGVPEWQTFPGEQPSVGLTSFGEKIQTFSQAAYVEASWEPIPRLKLIPGLRGELYWQPQERLFSVEPRLAARYGVRDGTVLKAGWGIFRQGPNPQNIGQDRGNPLLGLARSYQNVVGVEQRLASRLSLDVQAFYNWRMALIEPSLAVVERNGKTTAEYFANTGRGQAYGLEVLLKQDVTDRMFGWIAYTLMRSTQYDAQRKVYSPTQFDQTHILTVVGSYKLDEKWEVGSRFRLTSGRPDTPYIGNATYDSDTNAYTPIAGIVGSVRAPLFHQLDLRVERGFTYEQWKLSAYLDIQNVYNATNAEFITWDYRYRVSSQVQGLPFLPTLGVTGSF